MSDRLGWFSGRGWNLQNFNAFATNINTVGECAAGIKCDAHENGDCIASREISAECWGDFQRGPLIGRNTAANFNSRLAKHILPSSRTFPVWSLLERHAA